MGRSIRARGVSGLLRIRPKSSMEKRNLELSKIAKNGEKVSTPSKRLKTRYVDSSGGRVFYANESSESNISIIYIHGGSYYADFTSFHWSFLKKIIRKTNAKIIAPAYRLVPFGTYKEAFDFIVALYKDYIKKHPNDKIILMGDSAGGGFALAIAIYMKMNEIFLLDELVLISPWVDVGLHNPEIKKYVDKDPFLNVEALRASVKPWLGTLDEKNWQVSPLYGDLSGLHNVTIFVGTREIFYPDIVKLYQKLDVDGNNELIIGKDMNHAYPIIPIPESREALRIISRIIKR